MTMCKMTIILKPFAAEPVVDMLWAEGFDDALITEVRGFGRQKGYLHMYRDNDADMMFVPKIMIECYVPDDRLADIEKKIQSIACTGRVGDGKLFEIAIEPFGVV